MFDGTSLNYNGGGGGALSASFSDSVTTGDIIDFQLHHAMNKFRRLVENIMDTDMACDLDSDDSEELDTEEL